MFFSWGALILLPDIVKCAHVVAHFVGPSGRFNLAEGHPAVAILVVEQPREPSVVYDYSHSEVPSPFDSAESYVTGTEPLAVRSGHEWFHPIGNVVTALIQAGLTLDFLNENNRIAWRALPCLEPAERSLWRMTEGRPRIPLSYSSAAYKPIEKYV